MNQPTREEFDRLVEQVKRIERETEPMRLERRLSIPESNTLQTIMDMVGRQATDVAVLKGDMQKVKKDVSDIKTAQDEHFDRIETILTKLVERFPEVKGE